MIPITQCAAWKCGRYVIRRVVRLDNAAWPSYWILRKDKLVGRSFSVPDRDWCESIERITKLGRYVEKLSEPKRYSYRIK